MGRTLKPKEVLHCLLTDLSNLQSSLQYNVMKSKKDKDVASKPLDACLDVSSGDRQAPDLAL